MFTIGWKIVFHVSEISLFYEVETAVAFEHFLGHVHLVHIFKIILFDKILGGDWIDIRELGVEEVCQLFDTDHLTVQIWQVIFKESSVHETQIWD